MIRTVSFAGNQPAILLKVSASICRDYSFNASIVWPPGNCFQSLLARGPEMTVPAEFTPP
jgi:hypothetical protein